MEVEDEKIPINGLEMAKKRTHKVMNTDMAERAILSEKPEDNKAAAEWGIRQAELIKKSEEITQRLVEKYISIILSRNEANN